MATERTIENTPSWALAAVCTAFVVAGVLIILLIEQIEKRLKRAKRKPHVLSLHKMKEGGPLPRPLQNSNSGLTSPVQVKNNSRVYGQNFDGLRLEVDLDIGPTGEDDKTGKPMTMESKSKALYITFHEHSQLYVVSSELMQLGFISLLLIVFQTNVEKICIKDSVMDQWNPCPPRSDTNGTSSGNGRRLLSEFEGFSAEPWFMKPGDGRPLFRGRILAESKSYCHEGYSSIASKDTLHELHLYLFILACVHIGFTLLSMAISVLKMKRMRDWEELAQERARETNNLAEAPTFTERNRSFVEHHLSNPLSRNSYSVWVVCFFRQFTQGVTRSDYLTLRHGFIANHGLSKAFDFHGYMLRSLEDEFPNIVGISPFLWGVFLLCMLFNTHTTNLYFWVSLLPVVVILAVGTKLQHVIASLALDNAGISHHGRYGNSPLTPRDDLFWFNKPEIILFLIHYILFQTAFEVATFLSYLWAFGFNSCTFSRRRFVYTRVALSVVVFLMCSYHILPLYAVVIQMGSHASPAIFKQHVRSKISSWRKEARKRAKARGIYDEGSIHSIETIPEEGSGVGELHETDVTERPIDLEMFGRRRSKSAHDSYESARNKLWPDPGSEKGPTNRVYRTASEPIPDILPMLHIYVPPENSLQPSLSQHSQK